MTGFDEEAVLENYENKFLQQMNQLRKENRSCDVSFNVKGEEFPCHKLVLITASSYFDAMLNGNFRESDSHRNITLKDIEPEAFEEILNAVYTGRFNLNRRNAYFILRSSHMLLLMDIFNTVVSRIKSPGRCYDIEYLIETCLFAQKIQHEELYSECVMQIASNLKNLSKTDSFNEKITYDIFNKILMCDRWIDDSVIFQIVLRWNKHHKHSEDEILILLDSAIIENNFLSTPLMAKLIANYANNDTNSDASLYESTNKSDTSFSSTQSCDRRNFSENICHNVYLDVFNVKSSARGWAILQSKDEFNQCEIIDFQGQCLLSKYFTRKVIKIGSRLYCLEHDEDYTFFYIEDGRRINLGPLPSNMLIGCYEIEALENCLYLAIQRDSDLQFWMYDCLINTWFNISIENLPSATESSRGKRLYRGHFTPTPKLTAYDGHLYIIVRRSSGFYSGIIKVNRHGGEFIQKIIDGPKRYYHENPSVCCYDKKLVLCGGSDRVSSPNKTVVEYDMVANKWNDLDYMLSARRNPSLNYHKGFIYAVENKWTVRNEKYDIKRNEWTYIPSLPDRLYFASEKITLATGDVFHYAIE